MEMPLEDNCDQVDCSPGDSHQDDSSKDDSLKEDSSQSGCPKEDCPKEDYPKDDSPEDGSPKEDCPNEDCAEDDCPQDGHTHDGDTQDDGLQTEGSQDDGHKDECPQDECPHSPLNRKPSLPRVFPSSGWEVIEDDVKLEEENWPDYSPESFYPVQIGQVLNECYQVLGKLGYGTHSTVWLCRDLNEHKYVVLKICEKDCEAARRELAAYKHIEATPATPRHGGLAMIRRLLDDFEVKGLAGQHVCLIHDPMGISVASWREVLSGGHLPEEFLKAVLKCLLLALDLLHDRAGVVHADIHASNISLSVEDDQILKSFETSELAEPSARKVMSDGSSVVYDSRGLFMPRPGKLGSPTLFDLGEARVGDSTYKGDVQPTQYRAPEVILGIPWNEKIDIWNVGVLDGEQAWHMLEGKLLFDPDDEDRKKSKEQHLAQMAGLLGSPPEDFLQRSETSWKYCNTDGSWRSDMVRAEKPLEDLEEQLEGQNKAEFLHFIRVALAWRPEDRPLARELLGHPWIYDESDYA